MSHYKLELDYGQNGSLPMSLLDEMENLLENPGSKLGPSIWDIKGDTSSEATFIGSYFLDSYIKGREERIVSSDGDNQLALYRGDNRSLHQFKVVGSKDFTVVFRAFNHYSGITDTVELTLNYKGDLKEPGMVKFISKQGRTLSEDEISALVAEKNLAPVKNMTSSDAVKEIVVDAQEKQLRSLDEEISWCNPYDKIEITTTHDGLDLLTGSQRVTFMNRGEERKVYIIGTRSELKNYYRVDTPPFKDGIPTLAFTVTQGEVSKEVFYKLNAVEKSLDNESARIELNPEYQEIDGTLYFNVNRSVLFMDGDGVDSVQYNFWKSLNENAKTYLSDDVLSKVDYENDKIIRLSPPVSGINYTKDQSNARINDLLLPVDYLEANDIRLDFGVRDRQGVTTRFNIQLNPGNPKILGISTE